MQLKCDKPSCTAGSSGEAGDFWESCKKQYHAKQGLVILLVFDFCDNSMREKDWRCRKRGMQAM